MLIINKEIYFFLISVSVININNSANNDKIYLDLRYAIKNE